MKNIILVKELVHTGVLTITKTYKMTLVISNAVNLE